MSPDADPTVGPTTPAVVNVVALDDTRGRMLATTPAGAPNVITNFISPFVALFVAMGKSFFDAFSSAIGVVPVVSAIGMLPAAISDFGTQLKLAFWTAVGAAVIAGIRGCAAIFTSLANKYPLLFKQT